MPATLWMAPGETDTRRLACLSARPIVMSFHNDASADPAAPEPDSTTESLGMALPFPPDRAPVNWTVVGTPVLKGPLGPTMRAISSVPPRVCVVGPNSGVYRIVVPDPRATLIPSTEIVRSSGSVLRLS